MRILHLLPHLSGGGAERQFGYLAPELVRMGHEVHAAYLTDGSNKPDLPGVVLHRIKHISNYDPAIFVQLLMLIKRIRPNVIQTWILQMDVLGGLAARVCRVPWILREPSAKEAYTNCWKNVIRSFFSSSTTAIVSNSRSGDAYWATQLHESRRYIISNGLPIADVDGVAPMRPTWLRSCDLPIILSVGRLVTDVSANKNFDRLIDVLALVVDQQHILGVICGDGPDRIVLSELRDRYGMQKHISFTGPLSISMVWSLMKASHMFVSLSAYEGCPNSVMEAMACGCPLVLSDIPGHRELADEECALFVEPSNIQETADAILQVLGNPDAARKRAERARRLAENWSVRSMAEKYEAIYREAINGGHSL